MRLAIYTTFLAVITVIAVILWPVFIAIFNVILATLAAMFWFILIAIGLWLLYKGMTLVTGDKK